MSSETINKKMNQFKLFWDTKVKPVARKCIDRKVIELMNNKDNERLEKYRNEKNIKDAYTMYKLSEMIFYVEHDLADGRDFFIIVRMNQATEVLNSEFYWKNVWKGDLSSEEAKNLLELAGFLKEAQDILRD